MIVKYIKRVCHIIAIILWGITSTLMRKKKKDSVKKVLCILDLSGIGDTICSLDALYNLWINTKDNFELHIAAPRSVIKLLKISKVMPDAKWIEIDLEEKFNFYIFKENSNKINKYHWDSITKLGAMGLYMKMLLLNCTYNNSVGMEFQLSPRSFKNYIINSLVRNLHILKFPIDAHIINCNKAIVEETFISLGLNSPTLEYKEYKIPILDSIPDSLQEKNYCVICPSVSLARLHGERERRWPLDRFVNIVDFIMENSNLSVVLCGVEADKEDNTYILLKCKDSKRIIDMTGKTSLTEWIELIRNAKFIFGNDSGYIHLAAFMNTPSLVLAGYWNYGNFLPYLSDNFREKSSPINIRTSRPSCYSCKYRKGHDENNIACTKLVNEEGVYKCIWEVDVEQVKQALVKSHVMS